MYPGALEIKLVFNFFDLPLNLSFDPFPNSLILADMFHALLIPLALLLDLGQLLFFAFVEFRALGSFCNHFMDLLLVYLIQASFMHAQIESGLRLPGPLGPSMKLDELIRRPLSTAARATVDGLNQAP